MTAVAFSSLALAVWDQVTKDIPALGIEYLVALATAIISQLLLMIWCIRDVYRRRFPDNKTLINWLAPIVLFGVFGTTA